MNIEQITGTHAAENVVRLRDLHQYQSQDGRDGFWIQINGIYCYPNVFSGIRNLFQK